MSNLDKAIEIACQAHAGQVDKSGQPYILHPLRLMLKMQDESARIIAVLHDVVEDSEVSFDDLKALGFSQEILASLDCLTKRANETYDSFIARILPNQLARSVKIEDIKDNMDLNRLKSITEKDLTRITKYHKALKILSQQEE